MTLLIEAYARLILHDVFMAHRSLSELYDSLRSYPIADRRDADRSTDRICRALALACAFYPRRVLCLQKSAVLLRMLRRRGQVARMVTGVQRVPFKAHAWVEVDDQIVADKLATRERFAVLEVC